MSELTPDRVNFRPLRLVTALRAGIVALLAAFGVVLFLSFGRKEDEPVRIHLSQPAGTPGEKVVDLSDNFLITGTKGDEESFRLRAAQVTGFVGDKKILKGVHLEVVGEGGERLRLTGAEGQFDLADKRAQLSGDVRVEGKNGFKLSTPSLYFDGERDIIFTPDEITFASEGLVGRGRGLNYLTRAETLKIPAEVHVTLHPPEGEETPVEVTSGDMTLGLKENTITFNDSVVMTRGSDTFAGNYLKAILDEDRVRLVSVKAYGQVSASFVTGRESARSELQADTLLASLAPDGRTLERVEAFGNCRLRGEGTLASSESLVADAVADRISLRGDPVVVDTRSRIAAQEIDLHPSERGLEARGDVKTSFRGDGVGSKGSSPSYFSAKEPVFFQSGRLVVEEGGGLARFSGSARGWQGDDSIQAEEIVLHFGDRRMKAFRNVLCRFEGPDLPPASGRSGVPASTVIVAASMDFSENEGTVHLREGVKLTRGDSTVLADRMHVDLTDPDVGRRRVAKVLAEGSVRFAHLSSAGTADRLIYSPDQELAEMQQDGGLAEVVDRTNGRILRGKTLTFDIQGNRVLTETTEGGRTWITLSPKDKDTRGLESKIGH